MHLSKLDIGGADAGAGGMSMISGSSGASGMGASFSSSDASAVAQSRGSGGAGSGTISLANNAPAACKLVGLINGLAEFGVGVRDCASRPFCR